MVGLPKKYIKKYGVSKRAWAEYRKSKRKRKSVKRKPIKKRSVNIMAKRRKRSTKKKSYRRKSKNIFGVNLKNNVLYPAVAGGASGIIDGAGNAIMNLVPLDLSMIPKNYLQALIGVGMKKFIPIKQIKPILTKYIEAKIFNGTSNLTSGLTFGFGTTNGGGW